MQQCIKILFRICMKLNMFRATPRPSSGTKTALSASGFAYVEGSWTCSCWTLSVSSNYTANNPPRYYEKPEAASVVLGS
jgi:hypothetical protein